MTRKTLIPLVVVAIVLALAACQQATQEPFNYRGIAAPGSTIRIRNLNGPVEVVPSENGQLQIIGEPRAVGAGLTSPEVVRFVTTPDPRGLTVCAMWSSDGRCDAEHYTMRHNGFMSLFSMHRSTMVHFTVMLPPGLKIDASTINGPVSAHGLKDEVSLTTVNGPVELEVAGGPVNVRTVNGPIEAHLTALADSGDLSFRTVNGPVNVYLPTGLSADFEAKTVNGSLSSELPFSSTTDVSKHHIAARIGAGGRHLVAETVNGGVSLHQE